MATLPGFTAGGLYGFMGGTTGPSSTSYTYATPNAGAGVGGNAPAARINPAVATQQASFNHLLPTTTQGSMTPGNKTNMPDDIYGQYKDLLANPGQMESNPAYNFMRDQGIEAATRKMGSMGMRNSGNILTELAQYGTGLASQEFGKMADIYGQGAQTESNRWRMGQENELGFAGQDIQRFGAQNAATSDVMKNLLSKYNLDINAMSEADRMKLQSLATEGNLQSQGFTAGEGGVGAAAPATTPASEYMQRFQQPQWVGTGSSYFGGPGTSQSGYYIDPRTGQRVPG